MRSLTTLTLLTSAALMALPSLAAAQNSQGMSRERMGRIAGVMKQEVEKGTFPGAITLIARRGKIVHVETHGFQDAAKTKPMKRDTIFRMASMTKPMTTVAAMMLVEQGIIKIEDPIAILLPELKDLKVETKKADGSMEDVAARPVTIQDLMRHTSGLYYANPGVSDRLKKAYDDANIEARESDITADEMLKRLGTIPLAHQPAANFHYSISTDVLGLLVERAAKKPLDQVLDEMLIKPLGMKDTAFWVPEAKKSRLAEVTDGDQLKPGSLRFCVDEAAIKKSYFKGGAGLCSTVDDYYRFVQMVANGGEFGGKRYLAKKTVEFMLSDHLGAMGGSTSASTGPGYGFGLGFAVRRQDGFGWTPGSTGDAMWAGVFGTSFTIDPREKLVAIQMTQGASTRIRSRMLFKNLVYGAMMD